MSYQPTRQSFAAVLYPGIERQPGGCLGQHRRWIRLVCWVSHATQLCSRASDCERRDYLSSASRFLAPKKRAFAMTITEFP